MAVKEGKRRRWRWWWTALIVVAVLLVPVGIVVVPILAHAPQGSSGQQAEADAWPSSVTAKGDDGRTRTLSLAGDSGAIDTRALVAGEHLVVTGAGYDPSRGIYVAICRIPKPGVKPGPCIGGVPDQKSEQVESGTVQYAPSNWINDDWAWKLFGARSYDSIAKGTFTAYLIVGNPVAADLDCTKVACGVFTRDDHTALTDRVQDLHIPVAFG